jgi:putative ABC transport system permease protein
MSVLLKLKYLLPGRRRAIEQDMREELESLAALSDADGARRDLGSLTFVAEEGRAVWMWTWLEQLAADIRYACRMMKRNPGLTLTAVLSLALGIGANTAIFSLMNAILLKALPVNDPASLAVLTSYSNDGRIGDFGYGDYLAIRQEKGAFAGIMAASTLAPVTAGIGAESETVQRKIVSSNYFSVLEVRLAAGRAFREDEEEQQIAVIGDQWWRHSFGAAPDAVGRPIDLDGKAFTIVGIAAPDFLSETVGERVDVWTTMALMPPAMRTAPGYTWLNLMGRLNPGVSAKQAGARLAAFSPQMQNRFIERVGIAPGSSGSSGLRDSFSAPLKVLMGVVAVALLIACANLAGLLLARAASRHRDRHPPRHWRKSHPSLSATHHGKLSPVGFGWLSRTRSFDLGSTRASQPGIGRRKDDLGGSGAGPFGPALQRGDFARHRPAVRCGPGNSCGNRKRR